MCFIIRELRNKVLHEAHHSKYTISSCVTKMYQSMKTDLDYVVKCVTSLKVKFEHQRPNR